MQPKPTIVDQRRLKKRLSHLLKQQHNKSCAECPEKRPTWCSLIKPHPDAPIGTRMLASFICFQCAGIHRRLGTHVCFVRSVSLDDWTVSEVEVAESSGNDVVNSIYEANLRAMQNDVNIKPMQGAHAATRERYIRQKYINLDFYSKHAHYQHQQAEATSPADKGTRSPGIRKKLGLFLSKDKSPSSSSPPSSLGKLLNGGGGKSVCSATVATTPSDDTKSILSAPTRITSQQAMAHLMSRGTQSVCPQPTVKPSRSRSWISGRGDNNSSATDFGMTSGHTKKAAQGHEGDARNKSRSSSLGTDSNHNSVLLKTPSVYNDSSRSAFNSSRGSLNVSITDLMNSSGAISTISPRSSRMKLYSQRSSRGRSRSSSRTKEDPIESSVQRPKLQRNRSSSRPRDVGESERIAVLSSGDKKDSCRRGRSRSNATSRNDVSASGVRHEVQRDRSTSTTRKMDGIKNIRERARSSSAIRRSKTYDIDGLDRLRQSGKEEAKFRRHSSFNQTGRTEKDRLNHSFSNPSQTGRTEKDRLNHSFSNPSKTDDLTGMILIFDESCSNYDSGGELPTGQPRRLRRRGSRHLRDTSNERRSVERGHSSIRDRSRSRSNSRTRRNSSRELETPARPDSSRSRGRGKPDSQKSLQRQEIVEKSPARPRSSSRRELETPARPDSSRSRGWGKPDSQKSLQRQESVEKSPARPRVSSWRDLQTSARPDSSRSRSRGKPDSQKSLPKRESIEKSPVRPRSSRSSGPTSFAKVDSVEISPVHARSKSESRGRTNSNSLKPEASPIVKSDSRRRSRSGNSRVLSTTQLPFENEPPREKKQPNQSQESNANVQARPERRSGGYSIPDSRRKDEKKESTDAGSNRLLEIQSSAQQLAIKDRTKDEIEPVRRQHAKSSKNSTNVGRDKQLVSPLNSGEKDFLVIASNSFTLGGKGSIHSTGGPFQKSYQQGLGLKASVGGTERLIKDKRRCSRDRMAAISKQRHARKSDIFASLDREENETAAQEGPLVKMAPARTKSSTMVVGGKHSLMIRPAVTVRSKSSSRFEQLQNPGRL